MMWLSLPSLRGRTKREQVTNQNHISDDLASLRWNWAGKCDTAGDA